jgi:hypothetical protein
MNGRKEEVQNIGQGREGEWIRMAREKQVNVELATFHRQIYTFMHEEPKHVFSGF